MKILKSPIIPTSSSSCLLMCILATVFLFNVVRAFKHVQGDINYGTVLFDYMKGNNQYFKYELKGTYTSEMGTFIAFNMSSVKWLDEKELGVKCYWNHIVEIAIPKKTKQQSNVLMVVAGGNQWSYIPTKDDELMSMAVSTQSIVASIHQIPNQPLVFNSDPTREQRIEDEILAYAWAKFMQNTTETGWIPRLPMVKATVLAMDLVQEHLKTAYSINIQTFHVAGASKRGWTTNLVGVVDKRVKSIVPIVIPVMKTRDILEHTYNSLCKWPEAMGDYVNEGITKYLNSKQFGLLTTVIDPFNYNDILSTINKYFIFATGDQFFIPDLSQFSYPYLKGGDKLKHLRYVPNADHSLVGSDAQISALAYYFSVSNNLPLPVYNFTAVPDKTGVSVAVSVVSPIKPASVLLWEVIAPQRDFRLDTIGKAWNSRPLEMTNDGRVNVHLNNPSQGYYAAFVELTFDYLGRQVPLKFTTSVYILPDILPCKYQ